MTAQPSEHSTTLLSKMNMPCSLLIVTLRPLFTASEYVIRCHCQCHDLNLNYTSTVVKSSTSEILEDGEAEKIVPAKHTWQHMLDNVLP